MKVNFDSKTPEKVAFKSIKSGDLFGVDAGESLRYLMKMRSIMSSFMNSVDIEDGNQMKFDDDVLVIPLDGETNVWY